MNLIYSDNDGWHKKPVKDSAEAISFVYENDVCPHALGDAVTIETYYDKANPEDKSRDFYKDCWEVINHHNNWGMPVNKKTIDPKTLNEFDQKYSQY